MSAQQNAGEFIDSDFEPGRASAAPVPPAGVNMANRPPTREEIEALVSEKQIKLAELKRAQEELERERSGLEELRRRQVEFQTGRAEILQQLTRGVGLLEEAEMNLRRESDEMARALAGFREATQKVQAINEQVWTTENHAVELTRAATTVENARMEWNAARLRFPLLSSASSAEADTGVTPNRSVFPPAEMDMRQLFKFGLALNWPLVLLGAGIIAALIWRR